MTTITQTVQDLKRCAGCGEVKPVDQFYRHRYGWRGRCKPCYLKNKKNPYKNPTDASPCTNCGSLEHCCEIRWTDTPLPCFDPGFRMRKPAIWEMAE